jgi:acetolactate synthase small subunit
MSYWLAKVKVEQETARGTIKKVTEQFIVEAVNATDAEVKLTEEYNNYPMDWEVDTLKKLNIIKIIE